MSLFTVIAGTVAAIALAFCIAPSLCFGLAAGLLAWASRKLFFTPGDWFARAAEWCQQQAEA